MDHQRPIVAFLYDFDKTLCTTDMQNYAFIPSLGMTPASFWAQANGFGWANHMDGILAYMYTMLQEAERRGRPFTRADLVEKGRDICCQSRNMCQQNGQNVAAVGLCS